MIIYPKGAEDTKENYCIADYVNKYGGVEIQMFEDDKYPRRLAYDIESVVENAVIQFPDIKEIIVHLPLKDCYLEEIMSLNPDRLLDEAVAAVNASRNYDVHVNLLYHTSVSYNRVVRTFEDIIYKILSIIRRHEVTLLIENSVFYPDKELAAITLCEHINHPQLKACLDTTHIKCQASIYEANPHEFMAERLSVWGPACLAKHVKTIHLAQALNNDGFIDKKTHGRRHENEEELSKDIEILKQAGIENPIWVTEISEDDYFARPDQRWEIDALEKIL